jgi:hypothetical protein
MVDLGQTGGRDSACLFLVLIQNKKTDCLHNRFGVLKNISLYFSVANNLATSVQLITLKNASI